MAVQKNRTTPSKRGMRRGHDKVSAPALSTEATTGETHVRHHISPDGYYRGKKVIATPATEDSE
ncbi:MAG: large subunit ribosomal protein L32 [Gammaproteobacteria bacterium]|jgi:large subunit ribosomal protein L32|nr:50S ribosomal protein L32 [Chromatiales bacterium]|tara:strand:- start:259 stop:450 length:192 start_codon:yes stop_codon:yes gene_type:complete